MSKKNNLAKRKKQYEFDLQSTLSLSHTHTHPFDFYPIQTHVFNIHVMISCLFVVIFLSGEKQEKIKKEQKLHAKKNKMKVSVCFLISPIFFLCRDFLLFVVENYGNM